MDYKGIYFNNNDSDEKQFYEGGAHFRYKDLYFILENLSFILPQQRNGISVDSKDIKKKFFYNNDNPKSRNITKNKNKKYEVDSLTYKIINKDNILKKNKDNDYQFLNILFPKNITRNQKANNYILHYNSKVSYLKKSNKKINEKKKKESNISCPNIFLNNNNKKRIFVSLKNKNNSLKRYIQSNDINEKKAKSQKKSNSSISYDTTYKSLNKNKSLNLKNISIDLKEILSYQKKKLKLKKNINQKLDTKFTKKFTTFNDCITSPKSNLNVKIRNKHFHNKSQDISSILLKKENNNFHYNNFKSLKSKIKNDLLSSSIEKSKNYNNSTINNSFTRGKYYLSIINNLNIMNDKTKNQDIINKSNLIDINSSFNTHININKIKKINQFSITNNRTITPIKCNNNIKFFPLFKQNKDSHHISRKETEISDIEINKNKISYSEINNKQKSKIIKNNLQKKIGKNLIYPIIKNKK